MDTLKTVLKEQGRSQVWLARNINVNRVSLNYWINNKRIMPDKYKSIIAQLLGFPESILFPDGKN